MNFTSGAEHHEFCNHVSVSCFKRITGVSLSPHTVGLSAIKQCDPEELPLQRTARSDHIVTYRRLHLHELDLNAGMPF